MKRVVIFILASMPALSCLAQTEPTNKELEKAIFARDSVSEVLAEYRVRYAQNDSTKVALTPTILSLEKELSRLQGLYEQELASVNQRDAQAVLAAFEQHVKELANRKESEKSADTEEVKEAEVVQVKRNLVENAIFAQRLSPADYDLLQKSQQQEVQVGNLLQVYMSKYEELRSLQQLYVGSTTKENADSLAESFVVKEREMSEVESEIKSIWSSLYYNKVYVYDLLMERAGNRAMIDFSSNVMQRADNEISDCTGQYQSDVLANYGARKKSLTEYEIKIATTLNFPQSCDSLNVVLNELSNRDYRLAKIMLPQRNFIIYEDISVHQPSIYTANNPIPKVEIYETGVIYRLRVWLSPNRPTLSVLRGVKPVSYSDELHSGCYVHFVGGFETESEAQKGVAYLKRLGFKDPKIAVWVDGVYYPTVEDMHQEEKNFVLEIRGLERFTLEMKAAIQPLLNGCSISRKGVNYVVGIFELRSQAEAVATQLKAMDSNMLIDIVQKH